MNESWIQRIPKTELTWVFAWLIAFAVVGRYLWTGEAPDNALLTWSAALIVAAAGLHVGVRATTKPEVIVAEAQADRLRTTGELPAAADTTLEPLAPAPPETRERVREAEIP